MKTNCILAKTALAASMTFSPLMFPLSIFANTNIISPQNIETWSGEATQYIQGYRVRVGAVMTFNGQWNSRAWIIYSAHPKATIMQTFANPETSSVAVMIDFNNDGIYEGTINVPVTAV